MKEFYTSDKKSNEKRLQIYPNNLISIVDIPKNEVNDIFEAMQKRKCFTNLSISSLNENYYRINGKVNYSRLDESLEEDFEIHNELNPKIWTDDNKLIPEIREKIIEIVDHFDDILEEDGVKLAVDDIWLLGSNANYNYNDESDLDVHIIADESFDCNQKHLEIIYLAYKTLFNRKYDIKIKGINVEIYVENKDNLNAVSSGVYSIKNNKWIKKPSKFEIPQIDDNLLARNINVWESKYEEIISNPSLEKIDKYIDDIYVLRKESIQDEGEFGIGNLVFKEMRRCGYLDNLKELKTQLENAELSLEETLDESKNDIEAFINKFGENNYKKFIKLKDRLKNANISTDLTYHTKYTDSSTFDTILKNVQDRINMTNISSKDIPGDYEFLGEDKGYKVYKINDYIASINLGANTGWCTAGRYNHYNDSSTADEERACQHFDDYANKGIELFYFIGENELDKYAIAYYPPTIMDMFELFINNDETYIYGNYELFDAKDNLVIEDLNKIPYEIVEKYIGQKLVFKEMPTQGDFAIDSAGGLFKVSRNVGSIAIIPTNVKKIYPAAFDTLAVERIIIPDSVTTIYEEAIKECPALEVIFVGDGVKQLADKAFDPDGSFTIYSDNPIVKDYCEKNKFTCFSRDKFFKYFKI